jgi:hypothetical protein
MRSALPSLSQVLKAIAHKAVPALVMKFLREALSEGVNQRPDARWLAFSQASPFFILG